MICEWIGKECLHYDKYVTVGVDNLDRLLFCLNCVLSEILKELKAFRATAS